ncbi:MAG: S1 RNA-binding domain-containing protein [Planctomycetes bacterium]|nr:S1 RNA-binding domain-containing protein [Planctomycetota bacterium]
MTEPTPASPKPEPKFEPRPPRPQRDKPVDRGGKPRVIETFQAPSMTPRLRDLDKDIEAEMAAVISGFNEKDTLAAESETKGNHPPRTTGGRKQGKVISIHGSDVFVHVPGGRSEGVLPITQFPDGPPAIGSDVEVEIQGYDPSNGLLTLTRMGAAQAVSNWGSIQLGMTVEAKVIETNKGGLSVEVNGIRGFMPFRDMDLYRVEQPEQFVNQKLICEVIELNPEERNLVVSRRALMERERERQKEKFWAEIEAGQTRTGTVRSIKPFGVFVDLGGADGMIPVSELAWGHTTNPEDVVKLNQQVTVKVSRIDTATRKISLSLKQLAASPWDTISQRLHVGSQIKGKVTRTADFGAFVEIEPGVEGLIHISELGTNRVRRVRDVLQEGKEVEVQIVNIDLEQKRIGLSLKAIAEAAQKALDAAAMAEMKAREEAEEAEAANAPPPKPRKRNYELRGGK